MSEVTDPNNQEEQKTFTQEQVDEIVKARLARAKTEAPADYQELKEKAAKYDEVQEAAKTELQKATERADKLQAEIDQRNAEDAKRELISKTAKESGVDPTLLSRMSGSSEEEIKANADFLKSAFQAQPKYPEVKDNGNVGTPEVTAESILKIEDRAEREAAILEHIDLF